MQRNSKLAILIVLITGAAFVWVPKGTKGKNAKDVSPNTSSAVFDQTIPVIATAPRKRTEFVDWGRDPFTSQQKEEKADNVSDLVLGAIMSGGQKPSAFINNSVVYVGDKVADKTVKKIEQNRVILTDGTKDYVLELQE